MGWHLATGRWVVQHREIPRTDVLSFTSAGTEWTYPPFGGVGFYLIYSAVGYAGLSWFCALACVSVVAYLVRHGDVASAILAMLAVGSIEMRTGVRPDLFTTVFFALFLGELWVFHRGLHSRLWLLPVLMLLWVNLHPGFVAGVAAVGAYLLIEMTDLLFQERRRAVQTRLRRIWPWLAASAIATLVNPWGARVYATSLGMLGAAGRTQGKLNGNLAIAEFRGVPISIHMLYQLIDIRDPQFGFTWLLTLAVIAAGLFFWNRQVGAGVVMLAALYAAIAHSRYSALFAITVATLGPLAFETYFASGSDVNPRKAPQTRLPAQSRIAVLLMIFCCAVALLQVTDLASNRTYVVFNRDLRFGTGLASWLPARAAAFINQEQLPGNVFEDYELGGYAAWSIGPKYLDFIDGRGNNPDLGIEQFNLYGEEPDSPVWQKEADRWNLNVVWISTAGLRSLENLDPYKFCQSTSWRPIYMDDVSLVFLRNSAANSAWLRRLQIDCSTKRIDPAASVSRSALHEFYLNWGVLLYVLHRDQESEEALLHANELFSEDPNVHLVRGLLFERRQQYAEAEQEYRTSLAIHENGGVWYALSRLYGSEGRNEEALRALTRAAGLSLQPFNIYMTMGKLQLALNQPGQALDSFTHAERTSPYRGGGESLAPEVYAELAEGRSEAYRHLNQWGEAIAFQREALQRTPLVERRWDRLARLYEATGQMEQATEIRQRLLEMQNSRGSQSLNK